MAPPTRERAQPWLGTLVRIRVEARAGADDAIDAAFAEIATVHRLMSYQSANSDLGRIARARAGETVALDWRTRECLHAAVRWAERSGGVFDPVAAAGCDARWRDLVVDKDGARPFRTLRVDLSGIAKGYAVDRAHAVLVAAGVESGVIEAGGDLRVLGPREEEIALRPCADAPPALVAITDGALASSDPALSRAEAGQPVHFDGRTRSGVADGFVAVAALSCVDADALTKIVLAMADNAAPLLAAAEAVAYRFDGSRWSTIGAGGAGA